jgi:hypothetical protein
MKCELIDKMASDGILTAQQVERIGRHVSDLMGAIDQDPSILKQAGVPDMVTKPGFWEIFKATLPQIAASTAGGLAMAGGLYGLQHMGNTVSKHTIGAVQKDRAYSKMLEVHPDLVERDQKRTRLFFDSLHHFSPHYAADPLMAGEYVRQQMDSGAIPPATVQTVANVEKAHAGPGFDWSKAISVAKPAVTVPNPEEHFQAAHRAHERAGEAQKAEDKLYQHTNELAQYPDPELRNPAEEREMERHQHAADAERAYLKALGHGQ